MTYLVYLIYLTGFLPSIVWLLFYLKKDVHPESNRMILKIFFMGMGGAFLAIFLEELFLALISYFKISNTFKVILVTFLGGALIEEYLKYLAVRLGVFGNPEMDEVFDVLLYMIIASLGFAALENILHLVNELHPQALQNLTTGNLLGIALLVMSLRFIFATFLHVLCSALLGYFVVLSLIYLKERKVFFSLGLFTVTLLHGVYNYALIELEGWEKLIPILIFLIFLAKLTSLLIKYTQRLKSVCRPLADVLSDIKKVNKEKISSKRRQNKK